MASLEEVENQLRKIGVRIKSWGRFEMLELCQVLMPDEQIRACLNGHYAGGFAMLCATDRRVLLIDKKPFYLTLEDIRFDMISEVDYSSRLLDATVRIQTPTQTLAFMSWNQPALRKLTTYVQQAG